jgi:tRNA (cytidine/uridine-2'-O-)-methyltransferase
MSFNFQMVLYCPRIPQNTGSIARTCASTNTMLHLIGPLGFDISEKAVKRAGLDYWPFVKLTSHKSWEEFCDYKKKLPGRLIGYSPAGQVLYNKFEHLADDWIVHGREDTGLPSDVMEHCNSILYMPTIVIYAV